MSAERSEALVLRSVDYSETSRIVTLLSPSRGRLTCMAQGIRRAKSKLAGVLDTFSHIEAVYYWKDGRSIQKLGEASLLDGHHAIKASLDKGLYGAVLLEFVYKVVHENEPSHDIFGTLSRDLKSFGSWTGSARTHCCWQLLRMLWIAGYELPFGGDPLAARVGFSYRTGLGGDEPAYDHWISGDGVVALQSLALAENVCADVVIDVQTFDAVCGFMEHQLEASFKSLKVVREALLKRVLT